MSAQWRLTPDHVWALVDESLPRVDGAVPVSTYIQRTDTGCRATRPDPHGNGSLTVDIPELADAMRWCTATLPVMDGA